tara:strand:- start:358 stop:588 length:231 start_codon:yes stop_codon:yes gene_type:complete
LEIPATNPLLAIYVQKMLASMATQNIAFQMYPTQRSAPKALPYLPVIQVPSWMAIHVAMPMPVNIPKSVLWTLLAI